MEDARIEAGAAGLRGAPRRALLWRALGGALLLEVAAARALGPVLDNDLFWHLRTGAWIAEHRAVPRVDPFAQPGRPWVAYSWLFELLLHGLHRLNGLRGVLLYRVGLAVLIALALWKLAQAAGGRGPRAFAAALLGVVAVGPALTERPWLFTMLFMAITLGALFRLFGGAARHAGWLVPMFALWANLHIQFVYGLGALGLGSALALVDRRHGALRGKLTLLTAACTGATLLNPRGVGVWSAALGLMRQSAVFHVVLELQPPDWHEPENVLIAAMTVAALALAVRRRALFGGLLLLGCAVLGARASRDTWMPALASLPILGSGSWPRWERVRSRPTLERAAAVLSCAALLVAAAIIAGALAAETPERLQHQLAQEMPDAACDQVERLGLEGPLYNPFNWGGYLIWRLPRFKVSMDGRTNLYTDAELAQHQRTWRDRPLPGEVDPLLDRARLVLAPVEAPLTARLRRDPAWRNAYEDKIAVVFAH